MPVAPPRIYLKLSGAILRRSRTQQRAGCDSVY
jgi:hypothetical protein